MELRIERPEITAKNYLSIGPGEYPCGNNLYLIVTPKWRPPLGVPLPAQWHREKDGFWLGQGGGP